MATWIASGAGDPLYNGEYAETAYTWQGQPVYQNGNGRWLCLDVAGTTWVLASGFADGFGPAPGWPYYGAGNVLPANPWNYIGPPSNPPTLTAGAPPTYSIEGTVTEDSVGKAGVLVTATASGEADITDTTDENGQYSLEGCADDTTWRVTPTLEGYIFTPAYLDVNVAGANEVGVDFAAEVAIPPGARTNAARIWYLQLRGEYGAGLELRQAKLRFYLRRRGET